DVKALRTTGDAVAVAGPVESFLNNSAGVFSVSEGGLLAYQIGAGASGRQLTWFDRTGKAMGTIGEPQQFFDIEFSPDQKVLAARLVDATGKLDLWTYDLARGVPTRLTFDPGAKATATWSPDGRSIAFNSKGKAGTDLFRRPANGSGTEELLYADGQ